ncbi:MAG TPA: proline dehydrogenase family protein [Actinomycetota bacterium]|nr:proline dehydrogenase family protein [Actinomycetota bacterium]
MYRETLLWAAEKARVQRFVTEGKLTRGVVQRFVAGDTSRDAIAVIEQLNARDIGGILDLLGEGVTEPMGAKQAYEDYLDSIKRIEDSGVDTTVAVKPTQLGLAFDKGACIDYLRALATEGRSIGTSIEIDIEQSEYVTDTIDAYKTLRREFPDLRMAIQAYLRRTPVDLEDLAAEAPPKIRLVKGAYAEPTEVAFQKKSEVDAQYRYLTDWLFERGADPAIATHDSTLIEHAKAAAARVGGGMKSFEIQMLYGVRRELQDQLAAEGFRVSIYVPFGSAWYPYLMRRMAERPANLRLFLRALVRG